MELPDLSGIMNILTRVTRIVDIVAKVVNPIVSFMLPMLLFIGGLLYDFILYVKNIIPTGTYTWYIVATAIIVVAAIVLTFLFPGEKMEEE